MISNQDSAPQFERIVCDQPQTHVFRIALNRPEARNAQDAKMLTELNRAFDLAARDNDIKVVILASNGPDFSSGHDLRTRDWTAAVMMEEPVGTWCGFSCRGAEGHMAMEKELFIGFSERWRNIPKVTIAQVQGRAIAAALMLIWPCDLIVASDDASFADNTVAMGVCGAEFFNHPWELGVRKAKEMLFTSDFVSARDAYRLGMLNHVVPRESLESFTLELAARIARKPSFALKLAKEAVNTAQDAQGRVVAMQTSFALHQLSHAHNMDLHGSLLDHTGIMTKSVREDLIAERSKAPQWVTKASGATDK
jgi:enoyl-CoA hydratase